MENEDKSGYFVYLLRCGDGSLYCGSTNDLGARVAAHNAGKGAKYTRSRLPVTLAYFERATDKSAALKREYVVKRFPRAKKLQLCAAFAAPCCSAREL